MAIATFNNMTFQVSSQKIYTLGDFSLSCSLETESQDVAGKKPSTYVKGAGLGKVSFNVPLKVAFGMDVRVEYGKWKALVEAGKPYPFTLGGVPLGQNKWLIKSAALDNTVVNPKGQILSGMLSLEFEEYVREGSAIKSDGGSGSISAAAYSTPSVAEKSEQKRANSFVSQSLKYVVSKITPFTIVVNAIQTKIAPKKSDIAKITIALVQTYASEWNKGNKTKAFDGLYKLYSIILKVDRSVADTIKDAINELKEA